MGKYIGIDLGTTFSCMAYINEAGQPEIIQNREGQNITPSTVLFDGNTAIVGSEAKEQSLFEPENVEQFVKRHMGERDYHFITKSGENYTPEAVSGIILSKMKADAEEALGEPVLGAVITVPAYFNEAQRKATMDAGNIAGLNVIGIINEPTAAALAFGISRGGDRKQNIMVYDLGGGTFDVTIMQFDRENITVLGTAGDRKLGGCDFDNRIIRMVEEAAQKQGLDISGDLTARQDLLLKAETAKKTLSVREKANIVLNISGRPFKYAITRDEFTEMIEPLLYKTIASMETACEEAGLEYKDLDKILLAGGSTRIPAVRDMILEETGITPSAEVHADEAVAIGAAYHAVELARQEQERKESGRRVQDGSRSSADRVPPAEELPEIGRTYHFTDVASHGIGIVVTDDRDNESNSVILPKNVQVPATYTGRYSTLVPYQEALYIRVTQGEEEDLRYVTEIGSAEIPIVPRDRIVSIEVTISCDENSIIHVNVRDLDLNQDLGEMKIDRVSNLSDNQIRETRKQIHKLDIGGE